MIPRAIGPWIVAAVLLVLSVATRLPAFAFSVIDWDESLYFLMAEQWRAGHLPYTTLFDNKPIGIYAIFAAFQAVLGDSVASMRIAGVVATFATAILIYRIARHVMARQGRAVELCAGLAGAWFVVATVAEDGVASNTELFMVPFTCLAMLMAMTGGARLGAGRLLAIGLSLGVAFMVKYVAVFDVGAVLLATALVFGRTRGGLVGLGDLLRYAVLMAIGMLLPFLAAAALYAAHGQFAVFVDASLLSNLRRAAVPLSAARFLSAFWSHAVLFPPLYVAPLWLLLRLFAAERRGTLMLLAWVVTSAVGVASGGLYFSHYFIQILPVLCIATGIMVLDLSRRASLAPRAVLVILAVLVLVAPLRAAGTDIARMGPVLARPPVGLGLLRDTTADVAAAIGPELAKTPGATVYVFDDQPILYSLLHVTPPTRYAFTSFVLSRLLAHVAEIDPMAEFDRIMATKPLFVICKRVPDIGAPETRNMDVYAKLGQDLAAGYVLWRAYDDTVVFRRVTGTPT
ncbi:ArnT family glycosyltransferase [Acidisoma cladoniae]|jgi:4-amino-4-deoxy-L-arabinose transferase-like glycosyltransferase|uniref:ArnT family glycosyltransferase n=1 Tax=Acidisoma cladoniae TaxID=3040935 RepID=UPI002550D5C8|nr:glycosyltransferase family 39 protein [Acidisoma sp. PAMC 29798]